MRIKEGTDDYRYFPEPDLVDIVIDDAWLERVRAQKFLNYQMLVNNVMSKSLGLSSYDAHVLTLSKEMAISLKQPLPTVQMQNLLQTG